MKFALFAVTMFLGSCGVGVNPGALNKNEPALDYPKLTIRGSGGEIEIYSLQDAPYEVRLRVKQDGESIGLSADQVAMLSVQLDGWLAERQSAKETRVVDARAHTLKGKVGEVFYGAEVPASIEETTIAGDQGELRLWVELDTPTRFRAKTGPDGIIMEPAVAALVAKKLMEWAALYNPDLKESGR